MDISPFAVLKEVKRLPVGVYVRVIAHLVVGGFALLLLSAGSPTASDAIVEPADRAVDASSVAQGQVVVFVRPEQLKLERSPITVSSADPFLGAVQAVLAPSSTSPAAVVAAHAVETPPVAPMAPAAPYRFVGQVQDAAGATHLFLARENQLIPIKVGEVLDGQYRVAAITDSAVDLIYVPLNQVQQIGR